jgi:hypothetical protein
MIKQYIYHPGRSGEAGGKYIVKQLEAKKHIVSGEEY